MNNVIEMNVCTQEQFIDALRLSQNGFLSRTMINVYNKTYNIAEPRRLISEIQYGIGAMYGDAGGAFANAQMSQYSMRMLADPLGRYCKAYINVQYFSSEKEVNDLICVAAEIAGLLNRKVCNSDDANEKIRIFNRWVKNYFEYKNTGNIKDHTAIELLKSRHGVCQAIAAVAVLVLSYMGVKILYVSGIGKENGGWGAHAWNIIKVNKRWIHVDFTFSINSLILPSTKSVVEESAFKKTHSWDRKEYSQLSLDTKWNSIYGLEGKSIYLREKDRKCMIGNVGVKYEKPLLICANQKKMIDLLGIVRLLGGGVELIAHSGQLNICVGNKRYSIHNGMDYYRNGYFDVCVADIFSNVYWTGKHAMIITF